MGAQDDGWTALQQLAGKELGVSDWMAVEQERIDRFAECTDDRQWIHLDVERAARESPFGSTVAHGYLTLSLLARFSYELAAFPPGIGQVVNYGLDRVRFASPVRAGARIRDRIVLLSAEPRGPGRMLLKTRHTIEVEGEEKPALVAESLALLIAPPE
jgi:acyl dehydratase